MPTKSGSVVVDEFAKSFSLSLQIVWRTVWALIIQKKAFYIAKHQHYSTLWVQANIKNRKKFKDICLIVNNMEFTRLLIKYRQKSRSIFFFGNTLIKSSNIYLYVWLSVFSFSVKIKIEIVGDPSVYNKHFYQYMYLIHQYLFVYMSDCCLSVFSLG